MLIILVKTSEDEKIKKILFNPTNQYYFDSVKENNSVDNTVLIIG